MSAGGVSGFCSVSCTSCTLVRWLLPGARHTRPLSGRRSHIRVRAACSTARTASEGAVEIEPPANSGLASVSKPEALAGASKAIEKARGRSWNRRGDSSKELIWPCDPLVMATPTWLGQPSSVAKLVLERMDAMISETKQDGTYAAYNKVAGVVVTGNEDGAHHVITEVAGALIDIGFTIPGQAWTYWNMGPGPGPSYTETDHKHDWSESTGRTMAANMVAVATALRAQPRPPAA